jgi:hypothetical protein
MMEETNKTLFTTALNNVCRYIKARFPDYSIFVLKYDLGNDSGNVSNVYLLTNYSSEDIANLTSDQNLSWSRFMSDSNKLDAEDVASALKRLDLAWDSSDVIGNFIDTFFAGVSGNNYPLINGTIIIDLKKERVRLFTDTTKQITEKAVTDFSLDKSEDVDRVNSLIRANSYDFPFEINGCDNTTIIATVEDD